MHPTETIGDNGFQGPHVCGISPAMAALCAHFSQGCEKCGLIVSSPLTNSSNFFSLHAMKIIMAASEMTPFAKTGGLADVMGTLPHALAKRGHEVIVFIPFYRCVDAPSAEFMKDESIMVGSRSARFKIFSIFRKNGVRVFAIRKEEYFDRSELYGLADRDYEDNAERFAFFNQAVMRAMAAMDLDAQVIHAHDWQTALIPVYAQISNPGLSEPVRTLFTIHNLAYQGAFDSHAFGCTNLPGQFFSMDGLEFYGRFNFLKGGILFADWVSTVSRRYAKEIQTPEHGFGLDGVLRAKHASLTGIMNGVDYSTWNPETDVHLPQQFGAGSITRKERCKSALVEELKLESAVKKPLFGMVTRFARQKGCDLLLQALPEMLQHGALFAVLGNGNAAYEKAFRHMAEQHPGQFAFTTGFNDGLAHRIYGGSDFFLMPSLYEPCGLSQLYAMRYGTIPLVRATGGLDDSVQGWDPKTRRGNGIKFQKADPADLVTGFEQAMDVYRNSKTLATLRQNAMAADFSWDKSAAEYETLYQSLCPHA